MGIFCEIGLCKPPNEVYRPGEVVSGVIKYTINEPMEVDRIVASLKGIGWLILRVTSNNNERTYRSTQNLVDIDVMVENRKTTIAAGAYEVKFNYLIPQDIPSTLKFEKYFDGYKVKCNVGYYVCITFHRPGFFSMNKQFNREINVVSEIIPTLPREPVVYGKNKQLTHFFSSKNSVINIKATIQNSRLRFGGEIEVYYEVENNSRVKIERVVNVLVEAHTFQAHGYYQPVTDYNLVSGINAVYAGPVNRNDTLKMTVKMNVPPHVYNIQNTNLHIARRQNLFRIVVQLPVPHRNEVLDIPVEIGVCDENGDGIRLEQVNEDISYNDAPPTYWEAMGEKNQDGSED